MSADIDREERAEAGAQEQIVMFELAGETYGISLGIVQEVICKAGITGVPQARGFVEGVINLRGFVIPVVDLRKRFGLGAVENSRSARIMIVELDEQVLGISVDKVLEVTSIPVDSVEPPSPLLRSAIKADYLEGFAEVNDELVKVLNFGKIFSEKELSGFRELEEAPE